MQYKALYPRILTSFLNQIEDAQKLEGYEAERAKDDAYWRCSSDMEKLFEEVEKSGESTGRVFGVALGLFILAPILAVWIYIIS